MVGYKALMQNGHGPKKSEAEDCSSQVSEVVQSLKPSMLKRSVDIEKEDLLINHLSTHSSEYLQEIYNEVKNIETETWYLKRLEELDQVLNVSSKNSTNLDQTCETEVKEMEEEAYILLQLWQVISSENKSDIKDLARLSWQQIADAVRKNNNRVEKSANTVQESEDNLVSISARKDSKTSHKPENKLVKKSEDGSKIRSSSIERSQSWKKLTASELKNLSDDIASKREVLDCLYWQEFLFNSIERLSLKANLKSHANAQPLPLVRLVLNSKDQVIF